MGRIRSVKPSVHLDEELWDLEQETKLPIFRGFVGLWNEADREGRFEWRARKLKAAILPYWDGDFSRVLDALTTRGFVLKYTVDGREYGVVRTFNKHQIINNREAPSSLPPPPEKPIIPTTPTRGPRVPDASVTPLCPALVEGKGREGKGVGRTRDERDEDPDADAPSVGSEFSDTLFLQPLGKPPGDLREDPEPKSWVERAAEAFGVCHDKLQLEETGGLVEEWIVAGRGDMGYLHDFEKRCRGYASRVPGLDAETVAQCVIDQFFSAPGRAIRNAFTRYLVTDFQRLTIASDALRAHVEHLRGAA